MPVWYCPLHPREGGKDGVAFLLEFMQQGINKAVPVKMRVAKHAGAVLEKKLGVIGCVHQRLAELAESGVPATGLETRHGSIGNQDIGSPRLAGFGFLVEPEQEGPHVQWQVMLGNRMRMNAVDVHPAQPKELTGAKPAKPEEGICKSCHGPATLSVRGEGAVEIVIKVLESKARIWHD